MNCYIACHNHSLPSVSTSYVKSLLKAWKRIPICPFSRVGGKVSYVAPFLYSLSRGPAEAVISKSTTTSPRTCEGLPFYPQRPVSIPSMVGISTAMQIYASLSVFVSPALERCTPDFAALMAPDGPQYRHLVRLVLFSFEVYPFSKTSYFSEQPDLLPVPLRNGRDMIGSSNFGKCSNCRTSVA